MAKCPARHLLTYIMVMVAIANSDTTSRGQVLTLNVSGDIDEVNALTRLPDQTLLLVGQRSLGDSAREREARLVTFAADGMRTATTLGSLGENTTALGISPSGEFIVGSSSKPNGPSEAVLWLRADPSNPVGMGMPIGSFSLAVAVSDDGTAVGSAGFGLPFRWTFANGPMQPIADSGIANDISGDGGIIVGASPDEGFLTHATMWDENTFAVLSDAIEVDGINLAGVQSIAEGISPNSEYIVGFTNIPDPEDVLVAHDVATLWQSDSPLLLEDHAGQIEGRATSVTDSGFVVGDVSNAGGGETPFIWHQDIQDGQARGFAEWLATDHDAALPGEPRAIGDVHWNGSFLDIAVQIGDEAAYVVSVMGDFNGDGRVNLEEINSLCDQVGVGIPADRFDLDGDGTASQVDMDLLLSQLGTLRGDADLDKMVQFSDFTILAENFGQADRRWSQGDFDCSADVQFPDFVVLADNFGRKGSNVASHFVPEPVGIAYTVPLLFAIVFVLRNCQAAGQSAARL